MGLAGCEDGQSLFAQREAPPDETAAPAEAPAPGATRLVERDVEAPKVFSAAEAGLWDGRPSLGGVWVAYPNVKDPERVIIRNPANGKFVIGALFRRERELPGPRLQVSSDAAAALGLLAGQPGKLEVTALRREQVAEEAAPPPATPALDTPETIATETLPTPGQGAAPAAATPTATAQATPRPQAKPAPKPAAAASPASGSGRNLIQIGIFSIESNATGAAAGLRKSGAQVTVRKEQSSGKTFWRVLAGPATTDSARSALMAKVKAAGFKDAFFVAR